MSRKIYVHSAHIIAAAIIAAAIIDADAPKVKAAIAEVA